MSNLLATLVSSANALQAYGTVLETSQNNVANASTPGWAKQSVELYALAFDPQHGITGGVSAGKVISARDEYSEQAVRQQTSGLGYQEQLVNSLTSLQAGFDVSGDTEFLWPSTIFSRVSLPGAQRQTAKPPGKP